MKLKKIAAGLLAMVMIVAGAAGCKGKSAEEGKKNAKGKYVEKETALPLSDSEEGVGMVQLDQKTLRFYTIDKTSKEYKAYDYDGKDFKETDASWLNQVTTVTEQGGYIAQIIHGEDGNIYALYTGAGNVSHILKEGDAQEIAIPDLSTPGEFGAVPYIASINTDEKGNLYLGDPVAKEIHMYGPEGGSKIRSFGAGSPEAVLSMMADVRGNSLLAINESSDGFVCYNTESGEVISETKYDGEISEGSLRLGEDKDIYYTDSKGIHHLTLGGTVSEDIVDGSTTSIGVPNRTVQKLFFGEDEKFYIFMAESGVAGSVYKLYEYVYDKNAKAVPDETLQIYGLKESKAVRQAIAEFQQKHPDVGVEYKTGSSGEGTATDADSIRALNTELLGGNGADVIMLDGLPVQSYIEKGVLDDLSKSIKEEELQKNIIEPYKQDGKLYQIPTRYGIPLLLGDNEKKEALKSAEALKTYIDKNPDSKLFEGEKAENIMKLLIDINYSTLVGKDQKVKTEELSSLMETAKQLADPASEQAAAVVNESGTQYERSGWDLGDTMGYGNSGTVASKEIQGVMGMMVPFYSMRTNGEELTDIDGIYVPHDIAGINKASKNKELAQDFISALLSEDVQSLDMESGFPVNKKAMEAFIQSVEESPEESSLMIGISSSDGESSQESVEITLPYRQEVKELAELSDKLTKPAQTDEVIGDMMQNEAKAYFDGSSSAEDAAKAAASKVDTYLAQ